LLSYLRDKLDGT
jgi:hypothetical protein